jgi:hypothetical protein
MTFYLIIKSSQFEFLLPYLATGEMRNSYKILVGKPQRKRILGRLGIDAR